MITAEEFFRQKLYEKHPQRSCISLHYEMITAEEGMRWAHEFKQLHLYGVGGPASASALEGEQLGNEAGEKGVCDGCEDISGFYLGTACPKCNRPFRQVK